MRIDPAQIGEPLQQLVGGGADAARGQDIQRQSQESEGETPFESLDSLMLKRLRVSSLEESASVVTTFAEAAELAARTKDLMAGSPTGTVAAHGELARDRLRDLFGER